MANYRGIYWHENEVPNSIVANMISRIDDIIIMTNYIKMSECRELSLAVTKLQEAQLWLTQISG